MVAASPGKHLDLFCFKQPDAILANATEWSKNTLMKTSTPSSTKNGKMAGQQGTPWETLVVFAINLKQLNVQMNMSNVMGNNTYNHETETIFALPRMQLDFKSIHVQDPEEP
ncbi:hypothetical protein CRUP_024402 [Coryphaenoides rupestris]|nr:hypothetical protein CRUP_024402 [Coryphaenoides rupestris]